MEKKRIIFLYSELAAYFLACVDKLITQPNVEVHIVRWEVNNEAPFQFAFSPELKIYGRKDFVDDEQLLAFVTSLKPSLIYCSGWMDKGYLKVCKRFKNEIPVVVGFDNQWKGTFRQYVATWLSPFKILNHFSHCWVPGELQHQFAIRLGFDEKHILKGFYSCDFDLFHEQYLKNKAAKQQSYPKRFIYVGRYYEFKGIKDLWRAFIDIQKEIPNEWELWCFGVGDIAPVVHPKIKHFGFVQPSDLVGYLKEAGVFILPSHFEPWGVVVHEFAASGFPIICSDSVGAASAFVTNDFNGYIYRSGDIEALKSAMLNIIKMEPRKLIAMANNSAEKAAQITPEKWAKQLMVLV